MTTVPLLTLTQHDCYELRQRPENIDGIAAQGSMYGCGWNCLWILGYVTKDEAQTEVDKIAADHTAGISNPGLPMFTMMDVIQPRMPATMPPLQRLYYKFARAGQRNAQEINDVMIEQLIRPAFRNHPTVHDFPFAYMIIKEIINKETGMGHIILLEFINKGDRTFDVNTFDVQKNRRRTFRAFGAYMADSAFYGISTIAVIMPTGGKLTKPKRRKTNKQNKKNKSQKKGGAIESINVIKETDPLMNDPELNPMTKTNKKEYQTLMEYVDELDKEFDTRHYDTFTVQL
jgi:hypothetical protein